MKTAKDAKDNVLQFGELETKSMVNVTTTTGVQIDADTRKYIRITPMNDDAWVQITSGQETGTVEVGALIPIGSSLTLIIPKAYYICSDTSINVVPYGFA
jgi:hypothetical protein